jgi:RNA polymerase subunit RPABC4/transcription elongation factor Spt4
MSAQQTEDRQRRAAIVLSNPTGFKVCEGCESIIRSEASFCPLCHAYRFNEDPKDVIEGAILIAMRPSTIQL